MHRLVTVVVALVSLIAASPAVAAPNVVAIETDDQTVADMAAMPRTRALIGGRGVTFANSFVSQPQCCPSRATFLTGQYAHNHGVRAVGPPHGGNGMLRADETLPIWLQRAGYATGMIGKYLNGYGRERPRLVPPGWTHFEGLLSRFTYRFYDYTWNANGALRTFGSSPAEYQSDVITARSEDFIRRNAGPRPFFLWINYVAPHTGRPGELSDPLAWDSAVPALRHQYRFFGAQLPRPPSFDEADVSDKPSAIRRRPRLGRQLAELTENWRQRQESLLAVDEGVARIVRALEAAGELEDTLIIFTSDNGFLLGEHRVARGKTLPYETSIRVPLLMRGPGIPERTTRRELAWNGDLAPTILDAAGTGAPFPLDGTSLLGSARGAGGPGERAVVLEGPPTRDAAGRPDYLGLRTQRFKYVEYVGGEVELYDLARDPHELENLANTAGAAAVQRRLAARLARLGACAGPACR